jgi:hypothetical protein
MSTERESTRVVLDWLREPTRVDAERLLLAVLDQVDSTPQRRRFGPARRSSAMHPMFKYALAAAAAVIVAVGAIRFAPGLTAPGGPFGPSPSPSPSPIPMPGTGPLVPGTYVLTTVSPLRITFTVPAATVPGTGWQKNVAPNAIWTDGSDGRVGFGTVDNLYVDPCATVLAQRDPPVGPTVDDLVGALVAMPGLDTGTVTDTTFAGRPAKVVEIVATVAQVDCGLDGYALWDEVPLDEGRTRIIVLDVEGTRLAIQAVERPPLPQGQRDELQQILDSVRIEAP